MKDKIIKLAWIGMKGLFFVILVYGGLHVYTKLQNDGVTLNNIVVSLNDIKNTMSNFSRQLASNTHDIATLKERNEGLQ
jgi:hypothetical protein